MKECRSAIPAWIMPVYRVAESVRPGADAFDVVIVDEASQSGPEALFLYYLGKQIVVVGDDKQISPDSVGIPRDDVELLRQRYIADLPHNDAMGVDNSFFDQAEIRYGGRIRLREHFRCMPEIIQFSNNLCYRAEPLVPLRHYGSGRLSPVISPYHVPDGYQKGRTPRVVNPPEAEAIVSEIKKSCESSAYDGKSMGVISLLGQHQARLIERLLLEEIGPEEMENRNLVCGDSYAFQGDERDIIFISLVSAPTEGQRIGTLASQRDEKRFNVAASRAKDQMWLFHTATLNDLSPRCHRYKLLEYCLNPQVEQTAIEDLDLQRLAEAARTADRNRMPPPTPFDSWFEVDVFLKIAKRGYRIIPQYETAGYFIDLLVEGMQGRLAVECDGDEWHGLAQYEQDMARQRQLERCGLQFWRIRGSTFSRDPDAALSGLWETLERLNIYPGPSGVDTEEPGQEPDEETASETDETEEKETPDNGEFTEQKMSDDQDQTKDDTVTATEEGLPNGMTKSDTPEQPKQKDLFENKKDKKPKVMKARKRTQPKKKGQEQIRDKEAPKIDPSSLVDPLPHILSHILSTDDLTCKNCGEQSHVFVGPYGPYLKCTAPACKKTQSVKYLPLSKAFESLQIPCKICGRPMKVARGPKSLFPGCSGYPQCKNPEPWLDLSTRLKDKDIRQQLGSA